MAGRYLRDDPRCFGLHDPAIAPVVAGGRPRVKWLLCGGEIVVEDDAIPGLDVERLRAQAWDEVQRLMRAA